MFFDGRRSSGQALQHCAPIISNIFPILHPSEDCYLSCSPVFFWFFEAATIEHLTAAKLTYAALDSIPLSYFTLNTPLQQLRCGRCFRSQQIFLVYLLQMMSLPFRENGENLGPFISIPTATMRALESQRVHITIKADPRGPVCHRDQAPQSASALF